MKQFKILFLVFLLLISLTSCMPQNTDIKKRLVIEGIGLDFDKETEMYELTVQVLETSSADAQQGKSSTPVANYTVKGKTVARAIRSLGENTGKYPLYSQNRIIVIGETLSGEQMIKALNFFVREYTSRPDVFVAAASGRASDVLTVSAGGEIPAKLIESAIEQSNENSVSVNTELYEAVNISLEETTCITLPLIEVTDDRIPEEKTVKVTGTRACPEDVQSSMLSDTETTALLFITDKVNTGTLSVSNEKLTAALEIISSSTKTSVGYENGRFVFCIDVDCKADIVEFDSAVFDAVSEQDVKDLEIFAEKYIQSGMNGLLDRFIKEEGCDIFRFGKRIEQKYPSLYRDFLNDSKNLTENTVFDVNVNIQIGRIGEMTMN